jgi:predicted CXXCH cytochrome family protein
MKTLYNISAFIVMLVIAGVALGQNVNAKSIVNTAHNLSASGLGKIKSSNEQQVCIFCHTPHNAAPVQPLWNRNLPVSAYRVYSSSTLISTPGQPTGSSKLCLSCHDGTIALGSVLNASSAGNPAGDLGTLPAGSTNLGTDLSGDHPISFTYDSNLASKNGALVDPGTLPMRVRLPNRQLQCTSCHDAHDDSRGSFLVMSNSNSQLCVTCHTTTHQTTIPAHAQCADCHQQHNAPSGADLLTGATVDATCNSCHGGSATTTGANILSEQAKMSRHAQGDVAPASAQVGAMNSKAVTNSANCADCHEPHTIKSGTKGTGSLAADLGKVSGLSRTGAPVARAKYEYEICFKCHGQNTDQPFVTRQVVQTNLRREFEPTAASFHPIEAPGRGHLQPSLVPGLNAGSIISCTDCHSSDSGTNGVKGPHGSNIPPLLKANYETMDGTPESASAYALCYQCHERSSILGNESFSRHSIYIVDQRTPCSVCHDSHGISSAQGTTITNSHLMNFDTSVVRPDAISRRLTYRSTGPNSGQCFLTCHGKDVNGLRYP